MNFKKSSIQLVTQWMQYKYCCEVLQRVYKIWSIGYNYEIVKTKDVSVHVSDDHEIYRKMEMQL